MIIDFTRFVKGLDKSELNQILNSCLNAAAKCPQSLDFQYSPRFLNTKILDYWCNNETLFQSGYSVYVKKDIIKTLIEYRVYKLLLTTL